MISYYIIRIYIFALVSLGLIEDIVFDSPIAEVRVDFLIYAAKTLLSQPMLAPCLFNIYFHALYQQYLTVVVVRLDSLQFDIHISKWNVHVSVMLMHAFVRKTPYNVRTIQHQFSNLNRAISDFHIKCECMCAYIGSNNRIYSKTIVGFVNYMAF